MADWISSLGLMAVKINWGGLLCEGTQAEATYRLSEVLASAAVGRGKHSEFPVLFLNYPCLRGASIKAFLHSVDDNTGILELIKPAFPIKEYF